MSNSCHDKAYKAEWGDMRRLIYLGARQPGDISLSGLCFQHFSKPATPQGVYIIAKRLRQWTACARCRSPGLDSRDALPIALKHAQNLCESTVDIVTRDLLADGDRIHRSPRQPASQPASQPGRQGGWENPFLIRRRSRSTTSKLKTGRFD